MLALFQLLANLVHRQKQRSRRQQGAFDIVTALLVTLFGFPPEMFNRIEQRVRRDETGVARQVIEHGLQFVEKQRDVIFDARRHHAFADAAVNQAGQRVALDLFAVTLAEAGDGLLVGGVFGGGQDFDGLHPAHRNLVAGVKFAYRLDFIVEQVETVRRFAARREQVDNRTANRILAVLHHLRHMGITVGRQ